MADESDVEAAIAAAASAAIYPNGIGGAPVGGYQCRIARGEPNAEQLNTDLLAGLVNVDVQLVPMMGRNTTRYTTAWQEASAQPATPLSVSLAGHVATFGGAGGAGAVAGVLSGGVGYSYVTGAGDTPSSVAAGLAKQVPGATASGAVLTLPATGGALLAAVVGMANTISEVRRQEHGFNITVSAPTPDARTAVARAIDEVLASMTFITLADGSAGRLIFRRTATNDMPSKANLWLRTLLYTVEFGTTQTKSVAEMLFGSMGLNSAPNVITTRIQTPPPPLIGAIRFDGFYATASDPVNAQNAAVLSPLAYNARLPWFATPPASPLSALPTPYTAAPGSALATWPAATQATMDAEISVATIAGLDYWAFDSYQPTDAETAALTLYLSSALRSQIGFCMIGQPSNWGLSAAPAYNPSLARDVALFAQPGYVTVLGGRPLYYLVNADTSTAGIAAIAHVRALSVAQGTGNPYIVALNGALLSQYNNVTAVAIPAGCDAAGAYSPVPNLTGSTQPYAALASGAAGDWTARAGASLPMVPTAITGFDPDPLIATPVPYYSIPSGWAIGNSFALGTPQQIAQHVAAMAAFVTANPVACQANVGLVYSWNELAEGGGCIMPTYMPGNPFGDISRAMAIGSALNA